MQRLLGFSLAATLLATACSGSSDPQLADIPTVAEATPSSLAYAVETTEVQAVEAVASGQSNVLFACSDALNILLASVDYTTQAGIDAIKAEIQGQQTDVTTACAALGDLEANGIAEADMVSHMMAELPPDALGAMVQLSETLSGTSSD